MKEKYDIQIADIELTVISDDPEDFVKEVTRVLDERIRDMTTSSKRCSTTDAAILCALDYCSEKLQSEKKIKNLKAQNDLYSANVKRLKEENDELKAKLDKLTNKTGE